MRFRLFYILAVIICASCNSRMSNDDARRLVERYNNVVIEAYRQGDVTLIDSVVGPNEGRKLTGLIGVRTDAGVRLVSKLLSLDITSVDLQDESLTIQTREKWTYHHVNAASGKQVDEPSEDAYEMRYLFIKLDGKWMVDKIEFVTPPQVGRKSPAWSGSPMSDAAEPPATDAK